MATQLDIGNLQLHPGDYLEFEFLEVGTPALVAAAVHSIKASLANDRRWNYQGSSESQRDGQTYITIVVQVSKNVPDEYAGAMMSGFAPVVVVFFVGATYLIGVVSGALLAHAGSVRQVSVTGRDANGKLLAIWTNPDLSEAQKREATAAINANVAAVASVASAPIVSATGGMSVGLLLVGALLAVAFFTGAFRR